MKRMAFVFTLGLCFALAGCLPSETPQESDAAYQPPAASTVAPTQSPAMESATPSPTACVSSSFIELSKLPKKYTPEEAVANGDYVNVHGNVSNGEKLTAFLDAVSTKKSAALRTVNYTVEGDPIIADIVFDGRGFAVSCDTTRDAFGEQQVARSEYRNLLEYEQDGTTYVYLTGEAEITKDLFDKGFDGYLLMSEKGAPGK